MQHDAQTTEQISLPQCHKRILTAHGNDFICITRSSLKQTVRVIATIIQTLSLHNEIIDQYKTALWTKPNLL